MSELTVVEKERTDRFSECDSSSDAVRLVGIPPGDTNDKQLSHQL